MANSQRVESHITNGAQDPNKEAASAKLHDEYVTAGHDRSTSAGAGKSAQAADSAALGLTPELTPIYNWARNIRIACDENKPAADAMNAVNKSLSDGNKWAKRQEEEFHDILVPLVWNPDDKGVKKFVADNTGAGDRSVNNKAVAVVVGSLEKDVADLGHMIVDPISTVIDCVAGKKDAGKAWDETSANFKKTTDALAQIVTHPIDHLGAIAGLAVSIRAVPGPSQFATVGRIAMMAEETETLTQVARVGQSLNNMNSGLTTMDTVGKHEKQ